MTKEEESLETEEQRGRHRAGCMRFFPPLWRGWERMAWKEDLAGRRRGRGASEKGFTKVCTSGLMDGGDAGRRSSRWRSKGGGVARARRVKREILK